MKPVSRWLVYTIAIGAGCFIAWHFGIGIWAAYSYYQFTIVIGQANIMVGVLVLLQEVGRHWYEEDEE